MTTAGYLCVRRLLGRTATRRQAAQAPCHVASCCVLSAYIWYMKYVFYIKSVWVMTLC